MEDAAARSSKKTRGTVASVLAAFALHLAKHLSDVDGGGGGQNLIFSPLSIYAALALMSAGARGTTLNEVLAVLGAASRDEIAEFVNAVVERAFANRSKSGAPIVAFACALWHEKAVALKPTYITAAVCGILQGRDACR